MRTIQETHSHGPLGRSGRLRWWHAVILLSSVGNSTIDLFIFVYDCPRFIASAASAYSAGYPSMNRDLHSSELAASAGLSTFTLGFALASLILSSVSEEFGRRAVYLVRLDSTFLVHIFSLPAFLTQPLHVDTEGNVLWLRHLLPSHCVGKIYHDCDRMSFVSRRCSVDGRNGGWRYDR